MTVNVADVTTTRLFPKIFRHSKFEYHLKEAKHTKCYGWRGYYTCAFVRTRKCTAKIILSTYHEKLYPRTDEAIHTCNAKIVITEEDTEIHGDVTNEMKLLVESKALADMTASAYQIADAILQEMGAKYKTKARLCT